MGVDRIPLQNAVVRILDPTGTWFYGLGYRIRDDIVLTCAHVVADALDLAPYEAKAPTEAVLLNFPFTNEDERKVEAKIVENGWFPLGEARAIADIAVLRLSAPLSGSGSVPVLDRGISHGGLSFYSYGAPKGHHKNLVPIDGCIQAEICGERYFVLTDESGYEIEPGCSGAPVLGDYGTILGLIAQDEEDQSIRGGFLIPASHLRQALTHAGIRSPETPGLGSLRHWAKDRLRGAGFQLAGQVTSLVNYYAGTPEQPMPFAGREKALAELDSWFQAGVGSFRLVTGAAGSGKTMLLLHWMARVLERDPAVKILFLPVSVRFDTADELRGLRLLHGQLAGLFSELRFTEGAKPDQDDYREHIAAGWEAISNRREMRFLLVIDGADEASADWLNKPNRRHRILPESIPQNLSIALAARYKPGQQDGQAWFEAFRFTPDCTRPDPLDLEPLSKAGVAEAVAQLGHPLDGLPEREDVLDELYRLTDSGDPLLVNLWVGQLWREREHAMALRAADLSRYEPSFAGFLNDAWLPEQEEVWNDRGVDVHPDDIRRLLHVLAFARGPLQLTDILGLIERLAFPSSWDFERTRKVLDSAFRIVVPVTDGAGRKGYAFVHPRLGDHFRREFQTAKAERRTVPRAYLDWGAATVAALSDGTLPPEQCPPYLLRHYVAHVLDAKLPADETLDRYLLALLNSGWHQAWDEEEGAYGGYLSDIFRVQATITQANLAGNKTVPRLGQELRCWLIRASIFSLTENVPPELIVALVKAGEWTGRRAIQVASNAAEPEARFQILVQLAAYLNGEERQLSLRLALEAASTLRYDWQRARSLAVLAPQMNGESALLLEVRKIVSALGDLTHDNALPPGVPQLKGEAWPIDPWLGECLDAAGASEYRQDRDEALAAVVAQLKGEPALLTQTLEAASTIESSWDRANALADVAAQLKGSGQPSLIAEVLKAASSIGDEMGRAEALVAIVAWLEDQPALLNEALKAASAIGDEAYRAEALEAVVAQLKGEPALLREALKAVSAISDDRYRASTLAAAAAQLDGEERHYYLDQALEAAAAIGDYPSELDDGMQEALATMLEDCLALRRAAPRENIGTRAGEAAAPFAAAVQLIGEPAQLVEALATAASIADETSRVEALHAVFEQLDDVMALETCSESLLATGDEADCATSFSVAYERLDYNDREQFLQEAWRTASTSEDDWYRAETLTQVSARSKGEEALQCQREALKAASAIADEKHRAAALVAVLNLYSQEDWNEAVLLNEALEVASAIDDDQCRAPVLAKLAEIQLVRVAWLVFGLDPDLGTGHEFQCRDTAEALSAVIPRLEGDPTRLCNALKLASAIKVDEYRAKALVAIVAWLEDQPALLNEALKAASAIGDEAYRAEALEAVVAQLKGEPALLREALKAVSAISDDRYRASTLAAAAAQLDGEERHYYLDQALEAAAAIGDERNRAAVMLTLVAQLDGENRRQCLRQVLTSVKAASNGLDSGWRADAVATVAAHSECEPSLLRESMETASILPFEWHNERENAFEAVAAQLCGEPQRQREILETVSAIANESCRVAALTAITAHLVGEQELLKGALKVASAIDDESYRSTALAAVATRLEGEHGLLDDALKAAYTIGNAEHRVRAMLAVAASSEGEIRRHCLREAILATCAIGDMEWRVSALVNVVKKLDDDSALLQDALDVAYFVDDRAHCAYAWWILTKHARGTHVLERWVTKALFALKSKANLEDWAFLYVANMDIWLKSRKELSRCFIRDAAAALRVELAGEPVLLRKVLGADPANSNDGLDADALAAVAAQLEGKPTLWHLALRRAQRLTGRERLEALLLLARNWDPHFGYSEFSLLLSAMGVSSRKHWLAMVVAAAPAIKQLGSRRALQDTATAVGDVASWWP